MQFDLFPNEQSKIAIDDGELYYLPNVWKLDEKERLAQQFTELDWAQESIVLYGKEVKSPRLQCLYGDPGVFYEYSGKRFDALGWNQTLLSLKAKAELLVKQHVGISLSYNSVLGNLYRDGQDSMGWHADDEPELGRNPIICSFSFGAERVFKLKHKRKAKRLDISLADGSLLIMAGSLQHHWYHSIAKTKQALDPRFNFTFRKLYL